MSGTVRPTSSSRLTPQTKGDPRFVIDLAFLRSVATTWRCQAERYERDGIRGHAALLRRVADDLEDALSEWWTAELTLEEGAAEIGSAYDTLQRKVRLGKLPNVGRKGRPRVRRCDLYGAAPIQLRPEDPLSGLVTKALKV